MAREVDELKREVKLKTEKATEYDCLFSKYNDLIIQHEKTSKDLEFRVATGETLQSRALQLEQMKIENETIIANQAEELKTMAQLKTKLEQSEAMCKQMEAKRQKDKEKLKTKQSRIQELELDCQKLKLDVIALEDSLDGYKGNTNPVLSREGGGLDDYTDLIEREAFIKKDFE